MTRAEQVTDPIAHHGEGPVWFAGRQELRWVDMLDGDVLALGRNGAVARQRLDTNVVAALRPRRDGGAVIATRCGFAIQHDLDDPAIKHLPVVISDDGIRMNEGGCDPDGRFYCGSMRFDQAPGHGTLYRLDCDRSVEIAFTGLTISNGLDWSPDGSRAYYVDTGTNRIDVFDYETEAGLTGRRPFVEFDPERGRPDGLTVDSEGCVWVALWKGSAVHRYRPTGELDEVVEVAAAQVTACTFGGDDGSDLFITTSRLALPEGADPLAGALFRLPVGVKGQPVRAYHG